MKFLKNRNFWLFLIIAFCLMAICASVSGLSLDSKGENWIIWNISADKPITAIYINGINQSDFDPYALMYGIQDLEPDAPYTIKVVFNDTTELSNTERTNVKTKSGFDNLFDSLNYYFVIILFSVIIFIAMLTKRFLAFIVTILSIGMFGVTLAVKNDFYLSFAFIILFFVSLIIGYEGINGD